MVFFLSLASCVSSTITIILLLILKCFFGCWFFQRPSPWEAASRPFNTFILNFSLFYCYFAADCCKFIVLLYNISQGNIVLFTLLNLSDSLVTSFFTDNLFHFLPVLRKLSLTPKKKKKKNSLGWARKHIVTKLKTGCFSDFIQMHGSNIWWFYRVSLLKITLANSIS